uniref:Ig-like domain-containing protein n=1 Tax=Pygocentrus nattereri TaxID=42514 RepID=A0AAR2IJK6_PYGNA
MTLNTRTSLLYTTVILCIAACAGSPSAHTRIFISARVGSSAVLPCALRNMSCQSPHVEWRKYTETMFERRGGELYQGEGYKDREDVPEDHLLKGDCSLELKNVRPEDAGVYESFLLVGGKNKLSLPKSVFIQSVELSVEETPEEDVSDRIAVADDAGVNCHYPQIIALSILSSSLFHLF